MGRKNKNKKKRNRFLMQKQNTSVIVRKKNAKAVMINTENDGPLCLQVTKVSRFGSLKTPPIKFPELKLERPAGDEEYKDFYRIEVKFKGSVQGVGFRSRTINIMEILAAHNHQITGFVINLEDENVIVVAQGNSASLKAYWAQAELEMGSNVQEFLSITCVPVLAFERGFVQRGDNIYKKYGGQHFYNGPSSTFSKPSQPAEEVPLVDVPSTSKEKDDVLKSIEGGYYDGNNDYDNLDPWVQYHRHKQGD